MIDEYICEINLETVLDWQRSKAEKLKSIVTNEQAWLDVNHCQFWNDWVKDVFTLSTANEFGLGVWAIILEENIYGYSGASPVDYPAFGFGANSHNFFDGSFAVDDAYTYKFTLEQRRILLQLKAYKVLSIGGSIRSINEAMSVIFGDGVIVAFDLLSMKFGYLLSDSTLSDFINEILDRDLLPRPAGIDGLTVKIKVDGTFGFAGDASNFYDGNFYQGNI